MLLSLCLAAPLAAPLVQEPAAEFRPLLSVTCHGIDAWFVDEKDQRLLEALRLLDDRLLELPSELPDFDLPPEVLEMFLRLLSGPASLTVGVSAGEVPGMPLPLAGELRLTQGGPAQAQELAGQVADFLEEMGAPLGAANAHGDWPLPTPVPLWLGEEGSDVLLRLGLAEGVPATDQSHLLPQGARPAFTGSADYGALIDLLVDFVGDDPEVEQMTDVLSAFGLEELEYEWAMGSDGGRTHLVVDMKGWAATATEAGLVASTELSPSMVAAVPEDATWAWCFSMDLGGMAEAYRGMGAILSEDPDFDLYALVEEYTGMDVERDLIAPFGSQAAIYASDTTGGGGLLSTVAVIELADRAAFLDTWSRMEAQVAELGREEAGGYMRFSHFEESGFDFSILSFPGLPIPFELCMSTTERHAVLGISPQATQGAVEHLVTGERSLIDNTDFQKQLAPDMSGVVSVSWINTPRLMQDGFGTVGLLCSALANGMRSPADAGREPGVLMPPYHTLRQGALGIVTVGRRVGEDLRSETRADRSHLVNAAGLVGYAYSSPVVALVSAGVLASLVIPQVMQQQAMAEEAVALGEEDDGSELVQVGEDFEAIYLALEQYAIKNGGEYPETLEALVVQDESGRAYLDRKHLVDPWGDEYLYSPPDEGRDFPLLEVQDDEGQSPEQIRVSEDLEAIYEALELYAINNGGEYPETLEPLVIQDENGRAFLDRKRLVDPWGDEYLYYPPGEDGDLPLVEFQD